MVKKFYTLVAIVAVAGYATGVRAQNIPSSADIGRIAPAETEKQPLSIPSNAINTPVSELIEAPETAKSVPLTIRTIHITGATALSDDVLHSLYAPHLNTPTTLDVLWEIANEITLRYRKEGYFLSRAYVPAQEVEGGDVQINVVEGHVADIHIAEPLASGYYVEKLITQLTQQRPITAALLESSMLKLNALAGYEFRSVIEPVEHGADGAVRLLIEAQEAPSQNALSVDNFGSRFIGPAQVTASHSTSIIPLQNTTISLFADLPTAKELQYLAIAHSIPLHPDWSLNLSGSYVTSKPGGTLKNNEIENNSVELGLNVTYQPIRQRSENLKYTFDLDGKNSNGDILINNPLTRDRIRAARLGINYDTGDNWGGYSFYSLQLSRGIEWFGASDADDQNLSRASAEPGFTKLKFDYTRQQGLFGTWLGVGKVSGQWASGPLYSAEEFGYGGAQFGRAYDPSEITGDKGVNASLELRYMALDRWRNTQLVPYGFYDVGKLWNKDIGTQPRSASSAGFGLRLNHISGLYGNVGLAFPLTRDISTPTYGNGKNPRPMLQMGYSF